MAYKYQPIKDEILLSDSEEIDGDLDSEDNGENVQQKEQQVVEAVAIDPGMLGNTVAYELQGEEQLITGELKDNGQTFSIIKGEKHKQVIEQDGVLILGTVDAELPAGSTVIASGNLEASGILNESVGLDNSNIIISTTTEAMDTSNQVGGLAVEEGGEGIEEEEEGEEEEELLDCHLCGKKVAELDKHILANHGEKVECQLCNKHFPVGNLRWHILKEHCHNKVTECSLCEQKFVTKNALKNHIKQIHLGETSTCHICHKEYKDLYHHVKYFHERIRAFECSYCDKKFQAKKLLYNHVQSIHLGEKKRCPDCHKDISIDNYSRHVRETHEKLKKPCPHCDKEFAMSNLSRHIRQVHNNESTECPECGKALTISNLNKHIKSVHKKMKKTCDICNEEVPYSSISVHKRKTHGIGKPLEDVSPRGPNLKLRKRYRQMIENELEFDRLAGDNQQEDEYEPPVGEIDQSLLDDDENTMDSQLDDEDQPMEAKTIQVGERNFTFSYA
eukprot:TRINITY_DN11310_c0_g1_i3.p1 TRINITY_DN11310_c0_g1~~TRINITY_DN11310_c0_g1_i3.p1  ORF type:complete len:503 (-),score=153.30 TRINITY_DN11310_c0_g1_i3:78-1586(-)